LGASVTVPSDRKKECGVFGCTLPAGHNRGRADVPANHGAAVTSDRKEAEQALDNLVAAMHSGHYAVAELCKATVLNALLVAERERDEDREHSLDQARLIDGLARDRDKLREALRAIRANAEAWHGPVTDENHHAAALRVIAQWASDPEAIPAGVLEHVRALASVSPKGEAP
jgi:hypothetical protein